MKDTWRQKDSSISPIFTAIVAFHEPCHWLVRGPDLLHIVTISRWLMTEPTFFRSSLENVLLHLIIEPSLTHLELFLNMLLNSSLCLFIPISRLIVFRHKLGTFLALQHFLLGLDTAVLRQVHTDWVNSFVFLNVQLILKLSPQLFVDLLDKFDCFGIFHCLSIVG